MFISSATQTSFANSLFIFSGSWWILSTESKSLFWFLMCVTLSTTTLWNTSMSSSNMSLTRCTRRKTTDAFCEYPFLNTSIMQTSSYSWIKSHFGILDIVFVFQKSVNNTLSLRRTVLRSAWLLMIITYSEREEFRKKNGRHHL